MSSHLLVGLSFEFFTNFGIEVSMRKLRALDSGADILSPGWTQVRWSPHNSQDSLLRPSATLNYAPDGARLDHVALLGCNEVFITRRCKPQVSSDPPPLSELSPEPLRDEVEDLLSKLYNLQGGSLAMNGLVWGDPITVDGVPVHDARHMLDEPSHSRVHDGQLTLDAALESGLQGPQKILEGLNRALGTTIGGGLANGRDLWDGLHMLELAGPADAPKSFLNRGANGRLLI